MKLWVRLDIMLINVGATFFTSFFVPTHAVMVLLARPELAAGMF